MTIAATSPSHCNIAVITISKDDPAGLHATLSSISIQKLLPAEIIVIAAGSSIRTCFENYGLSMAILPDPGRGISAAFNAGIAAAASDWLIFLNGGDCFWDASTLLRLDRVIRNSNTSADIYTGFAKTPYGSLLPRAKPSSETSYLYISHQASAFRRDCFASVGGFDELIRIRMDLDWLARFAAKRGTQAINFVDDVFVLYEGSGLSSRSNCLFYVEEIRILLKYRRYLPIIITLGLRIPYRIAKWLYYRVRSSPRI